jgi:transposase-like protein
MNTSSSSPTSSSGSRSNRHWSASEKGQLVRRHLRDGISVANLAEESGAAPSQIYAWVKEVLEGADQILAGKKERVDPRVEKNIAHKDQRIRQLEEVAAELSMEVIHLKKASGDRLRTGM